MATSLPACPVDVGRKRLQEAPESAIAGDGAYHLIAVLEAPQHTAETCVQKSESLSEERWDTLPSMSKCQQLRPRCQFCDSEGAISNEHVFPEWIGRLLPAAPGENSHHRTSFKSILDPKTKTKTRHAPERRKMAGPAQSRVVRRFCKGCNNGWMSAIEDAAIPALTPLILGQRLTLSSLQLHAIATWATLKAIVGEYTGEDSRCISDAERKQFYDTRAPLSNWTIELASNAQREQVFYWHRSCGPTEQGAQTLRRPISHGVQTSALFMGHLFIYCRSSNDMPGSDGAIYTYSPPTELVRIWPLNGTPLDWSSVWPVSPWRLEEIANLLEHAKVWVDGTRAPSLEDRA